MKTKTKKSRWNFGVACCGIKQWMFDASYDRLTNAPTIERVFETEADAQAWIDTEMQRQESQIAIRPGQGSHRLYEILSLDDEATYVSRQDLYRFSIDIGLRKKALIESLGVEA